MSVLDTSINKCYIYICPTHYDNPQPHSKSISISPNTSCCTSTKHSTTTIHYLLNSIVRIYSTALSKTAEMSH